MPQTANKGRQWRNTDNRGTRTRRSDARRDKGKETRNATNPTKETKNETRARRTARPRRPRTTPRATKRKIHIGLVLGIASEKHSELKEDDPLRIIKGRYVFQGNEVRDENRDNAIFQNLGSSLASLEASKMVDVGGVIKENKFEQLDAEQAHIQADLGGDTTTWVKIPKE